MITSPTNSRVKLIKRLLNDRRFRQREQQFVVEGTRWADEIVQADAIPSFWLATPDWIDNNRPLADRLTGLSSQQPILIEPSILRGLADTSTPSGLLAVLPMPELAWPQTPTFLLLLDGVRDPGNLGTLMRSALAAGAEGMILGPGCVDPFNPKVVRSSMGAVLRLPIRLSEWADAGQLLGDCKTYLADAAGQTPYTAVDWTQPAAVMVGGEAAGASESAKAIVHELISIPMADASESLNAGVAGSIVLFEAVRQRAGGQ